MISGTDLHILFNTYLELPLLESEQLFFIRIILSIMLSIMLSIIFCNILIILYIFFYFITIIILSTTFLNFSESNSEYYKEYSFLHM